ncbi:hypothetical protein N007_06140 [Alicyclobacillus acidoterrestris ATCC 49025]|nr:hypothetical protein N007_06140 [Alicyclobacillus acidoterrestris ATCC 49025]
MFSNIGWSGLILILIAVLIVFGPKRLPDIGKALGRSLREFRNATSNIIESNQTDASDAPVKTTDTTPPASITTMPNTSPQSDAIVSQSMGRSDIKPSIDLAETSQAPSND